jgi:hypothetical protein
MAQLQQGFADDGKLVYQTDGGLQFFWLHLGFFTDFNQDSGHLAPAKGYLYPDPRSQLIQLPVS